MQREIDISVKNVSYQKNLKRSFHAQFNYRETHKTNFKYMYYVQVLAGIAKKKYFDIEIDS